MLPCLTLGLLDCGRRGCSRNRKRDTISQNTPSAASDIYQRRSETSKAAFCASLPYCTTCLRIAEVLGAKLAPPTNVAVMLCVPTANVEITNVT